MDTAGFLVLLLSSSFLFEGTCLDDSGQKSDLGPVTNIDSVLREMSAALSAQQEEIRHLQEENQENKVEIRHLQENQATRTEVDSLQNKVKALEAELERLQSSSSVTEHKVEALTRNKTVSQVAFSAALVDSGGYQFFGPNSTDTTVVYRHVFANTGHAYNPHTGMFTAPVRGVYHFQVHVFESFGGSYLALVSLMKNGSQMVSAYEDQATGAGSASNSVSVLLEAGDVMSVRLWGRRRIYDDTGHYNTFSGHLLFTL